MEQFVHFLSVFNLAACSRSKGNITFQVSTSSNYFELHSWESRVVCRVRGRFFCSSPVKWARGWIAGTMFGLSLGLVRYAKAKGKPVFVCINQMTTRGHRVWVLKRRRSSSFINVFSGQPRGRRSPGGGEDRTRACGLGQRDGETQVGCYLHVQMACSWLETVLMGMETEAFLLIDKPECRQALLFQASDHLCCSSFAETLGRTWGTQFCPQQPSSCRDEAGAVPATSRPLRGPLDVAGHACLELLWWAVISEADTYTNCHSPASKS